MPRGPRRGKTSERRIARKVERTLENTHGGFAGPSLIEQLETELLEATIRYLEVKEQAQTTHEEEHTLPEWVDVERKRASRLGTARGVMRGCAAAVAIVRNSYTASEAQVVKGIERKFVKLARAATLRA